MGAASSSEPWAVADRVLRCLAYGHARGVRDVVERLAKTRVVVTPEQVEGALVELLDRGLVEEVGRGLWRRA